MAYSTLTALFSDIAAAIRGKTGGTAPIAAEAFPSAIASIQTGGAASGTKIISENGVFDVASYASASVSVSEAALFMSRIWHRSVASFYNSDLTYIGSYGFYGFRVKSIDLPNVTKISGAAFARCDLLSEISLPNLVDTTYANDAFYSCTSLTSIALPKVTDIKTYFFEFCTALNSVSLPLVTTVSSFAFTSASALTYLNLPEVTTMGGSVFYEAGLRSIDAPKLTSIGVSCFRNFKGSFLSFPNLETIGNGAFYVASLTSIYMPKVKTIGAYAFQMCSAIPEFDFREVETIGSNAFLSCYSASKIVLSGSISDIPALTFCKCYNLLSLYLLSPSVIPLNAVTAFSSTPISTYTTSTGGVRGKIYVPSSLYASYIAATNWVDFSSVFASLTAAQISAL